MVTTLIKSMEVSIFGTAAYLKSIHADLQRRWEVHCERVEDLWRNFTLSQREAIFLAGVKTDKVLKDPNDQSIFRLYALIPEMNIRDIKGLPDYFLDHFEFRAATSLTQQYRIGLEGAKGDHQVIMESVAINKVDGNRDFENELTFFMDEDRYGDRYKAKTQEDHQHVLYDLQSAVKAGLVVPRGIGELILERQSYILKHLCILVDDILKLGAIIDETGKEYILPREAARMAFSTYPDDVDPQPICVLDLVTAAFDRKTSFEAYWNLCHANPAFLANAVNLWYSTRPDLVPDEKGRRMPLASDEYVSRSIFEAIHNVVIGIAIWDILYALVKTFLETLDESEQAIISQEISNICHYEYERIRKDFKRFVQLGIGSKYFKRLSNVFDNGTPRVTSKAIPDRVMKDDPQLHHILRLCQPVSGVTQAVRWKNMLDQLHYNKPLELDKMEESEFNALGEVSLTINLVNTLIASLQLPTASPKKGLTYISKLKELLARLDPLKTHTNLRKLAISLDDLNNPNLAKEALNIVSRFSEYYAGGSMVSLYQNLNKEFLQDLEVQLQEAEGTKKTKAKHSSTKSAKPSGRTTQVQQGQGVMAHFSNSSNANLSQVVSSLLETKSKATATFEIPTESGNCANPEPSTRLDTSNELGTSTEQDMATYSPTPSDVEALDALLQQSARPVTPTESEMSAGPEPRADLAKSTEAPTADDELFLGPDPYTQLTTSGILEAIAKLDLSESQPSSQSESSTELGTPTESRTNELEAVITSEATTEMKIAVHAEPKASGEPEASEKMRESELGLNADSECSQAQPSQQLNISHGLESRTESKMSVPENTNESEPEPDEPETSTTINEISPEVFKVSSNTLEVFTTIFSGLEESESNSGSQPGPEKSIKWLDFGTAMVDIGYSILPSVGSLYTFVPGKESNVATFLTLHRPYRSVIRGDGLLLLALRLKLLYGWRKETFELE
uniref:Uncharacterized protein n=1 Tax=Talaromyces marneffei PM1 TaxID=1077442 RepID=A0A093VBE3_TALMA